MKKIDLAFAVVTRWRFPVKTEARALAVSRSQLSERLKGGGVEAKDSVREGRRRRDPAGDPCRGR